jgi:transportin-3
MHIKIRADFRDLPDSTHANLRDTILTHLAHFVAASSSSSSPQQSGLVATRLGFAIAALAIQMTSWEHPVRHLIGLFGRDAATLRCALGPLTAMPEEATSHLVSVPAARRDAFSRYLEDASTELLQFLCHWLGASGNDARLHIELFRCLAAWLRSCNIPLAALATSPLVVAMFDALAHPHLFDVAVDCVCELVHIAGDPTPEKNPLLLFVLGRLAALAPQFRQAVASGDVEAARGMARIFCEAGETYAPFILRGTVEGLAVTEVLLEASAHPEPDIAALTFAFFHAISKCVVMSPPDERREKAQPFVPYFRRFIEIALRHMVLPANYEQQTADQQEEFKNFRRYDLAHALRDACTVMGVEEVLRQVMEIFAQQTAQFQSGTITDWRGIEATLYAVRSAARCVEVEEQSTILPLLLERLPALPDHPLLQYTAILVVGRYADWLNKNPHYLPRLLQYVTTGLAKSDVAAAAALSFQHLCNACARTLTQFVADIFALYDTCQGYKLLPGDMEEVLKGLGYVVSVLALPEVTSSLQRLCLKPATSLHELLVSPGPTLTLE